MEMKMILQIQTFCLTLRNVVSQYGIGQYYSDPIYQKGYQIEEFSDYEDTPPHYSPHRKPNFEDYNEYTADSNDCSCTCKVCVDLPLCCRNVCLNCVPPQQNILLVPYVYPIIVTKENKSESTTQKITTTTEVATKTIKQENIEDKTTVTSIIPSEAINGDIKIKDDIQRDATQLNGLTNVATGFNEKNKYIMTSLRRTKSNWLPKYGIVPIPDHLAEKILLQLRNTKVIHPQSNIRAMDFVNRFKN